MRTTELILYELNNNNTINPNYQYFNMIVPRRVID